MGQATFSMLRTRLHRRISADASDGINRRTNAVALLSIMEDILVDHIDGPLYYEKMGRAGPVMAFVHPNPMDQSCWIFQMAHMSTWFRCIAIDIPGYGRSPKAHDGLTMSDMAEGCWEAIETEFPKEPAILVGCSVGAAILPYMHHARSSKTKALIMCGTGYNPGKEFTGHRIKQYTERGIGYRWDYTFED